jgi:hypothetical protein
MCEKFLKSANQTQERACEGYTLFLQQVPWQSPFSQTVVLTMPGMGSMLTSEQVMVAHVGWHTAGLLASGLSTPLSQV